MTFFKINYYSLGGYICFFMCTVMILALIPVNIYGDKIDVFIFDLFFLLIFIGYKPFNKIIITENSITEKGLIIKKIIDWSDVKQISFAIKINRYRKKFITDSEIDNATEFDCRTVFILKNKTGAPPLDVYTMYSIDKIYINFDYRADAWEYIKKIHQKISLNLG